MSIAPIVSNRRYGNCSTPPALPCCTSPSTRPRTSGRWCRRTATTHRCSRPPPNRSASPTSTPPLRHPQPALPDNPRIRPMRYQLDLTLRQAEGELARVLGTTERRGSRPVSVDGETQTDGDRWHLSLTVEGNTYDLSLQNQTPTPYIRHAHG